MKRSIRNLKLFLLVLAADLAVKGQESVKDSTVFLNVTVAGEQEFLKDLSVKDFEIYDGKKRQEITVFRREDEPASVGVLFDLSGSMRDAGSGKDNKIYLAARGFNALLENGHPENDYFFITFGKKASVSLEPTQDKQKLAEVLNNLAVFRPTDFQTGFYDAFGAGVEKIQRSRQRKKVLILITDGVDNNSKDTDFDDIRKLARSADVLLYTVNIMMDTDFGTPTRRLPGEINSLARTIPPLAVRNLRSLFGDASNTLYVPFSAADDLETLSAESGGRAFYPINAPETNEAFEILAEELKSQYILGFKPAEQAKKNEWRKIEVKVNLPKEKRERAGKIFVRAQKGYYF